MKYNKLDYIFLFTHSGDLYKNETSEFDSFVCQRILTRRMEKKKKSSLDRLGQKSFSFHNNIDDVKQKAIRI